MLTKEQKLAILSKAIDEGATIQINHHSEEQADATKFIQDAIKDTDLSKQYRSSNATQWYTAEERKFGITAFFRWSEEHMEEDVKFEEETV